MTLEKKVVGNFSMLMMNSEISTRMILSIKVSAKESAGYQNEKMVYSSLYRSTNGRTKIDKQTRLQNNTYSVFENYKSETLAYSFIGTNLLSLYFREPIGIKEVYCDSYETFRPITISADGGYKVVFPNSSSNCYYYHGGVCTKIKVKHSFYTAEIILNQ